MDYPIFDAHCDTMTEIWEKRCGFAKNKLHIDFERMARYPKYVQVFAAFVDKNSITVTPREQVEKIIEVYNGEIGKNAICHCDRFEQIENNQFCSILSIEGGEAIEGSLENLEKFYNSGVRIMTLTWNYRNEIADGITEPEGRGLTEFGKKVVCKMNELGMVVDVSHLSEQGFWDVYEISQKPFIASHSNAKALCGHIRNLTDDQIKAIIDRGGVIGMNFYPDFLDDSGKCGIERICDHIDHILSLGGEDNIGLGSDFDGVPNLPDNMGGIEDMGTLIECMEKRGYGENLIRKITFDNFMRIIRANFV